MQDCTKNHIQNYSDEIEKYEPIWGRQVKVIHKMSKTPNDKVGEYYQIYFTPTTRNTDGSINQCLTQDFMMK